MTHRKMIAGSDIMGVALDCEIVMRQKWICCSSVVWQRLGVSERESLLRNLDVRAGLTTERVCVCVCVCLCLSV